MSTYAIGDLQGCFIPLKKLLKKINFDPDKDKLWFVGDLVNRGPDSLGCLKFVKSLGKTATVVLGNHDLSLLSYWYTGVKPSKLLLPIWEDKEVESLIHWLSLQPLAHYDKKLDFLMVHAGIPSDWGLKRTLRASNELQQIIQGKMSRYYFQNMWGDLPSKWNKKSQGIDRLRYITNALTRMRYCHQNGALDFEHKGPVGSHPDYLLPWFRLNRKKKLPKVIFGHWASLMGETCSEQYIAIDTGCVWGNYLSAYRLEDGQYFKQNNC